MPVSPAVQHRRSRASATRRTAWLDLPDLPRPPHARRCPRRWMFTLMAGACLLALLALLPLLLFTGR
ncbi:hypothetical protein ACYX79_14615 [Stenotrophomonas rhizophila]